MKRRRLEITEDYVYEAYDEFKNHYKEMVETGFRPHSSSDVPEYYTNHEMNSYYASYVKCVVNQY